MSRFSKIVLAAAAVLGLAACSHTAKVKGVVSDAPSSEIVVKLLNVNPYQVVDTVKTDASGKFVCKVDVAKGQPEFVYLFYGDRKVASLLLEAGDKVTVHTDTLGVCNVEGSEESLKLAAVEADFAAAKSALISISDKLMSADAEQAGELRGQLSKTYVDYYRSRVLYIMQNSRSLTVVPVLFQNLTETLPVFGQATDAIHFTNAADTLETVYPDSKYVKALRKEAQRRVSQMELAAKLSTAKEVNYLDIELPDTKGKKVKLSDIHKKLTLVYFWTAEDADQKMLNLDVLAPLYQKYHDKGFEIYQVSLDVDNGMWARVIREQKLPWTNVSDISGGASRYVMAYNLTKLPSAFLIGGDGMSGATIHNVASLSAAIEKLL
jgi:peroxiredoxin